MKHSIPEKNVFLSLSTNPVLDAIYEILSQYLMAVEKAQKYKAVSA